MQQMVWPRFSHILSFLNSTYVCSFFIFTLNMYSLREDVRGTTHSDREKERTTRTRENDMRGFMREKVLTPAVLAMMISLPLIIMMMRMSMATRKASGSMRAK